MSADIKNHKNQICMLIYIFGGALLFYMEKYF